MPTRQCRERVWHNYLIISIIIIIILLLLLLLFLLVLFIIVVINIVGFQTIKIRVYS